MEKKNRIKSSIHISTFLFKKSRVQLKKKKKTLFTKKKGTQGRDIQNLITSLIVFLPINRMAFYHKIGQ